MDTRQKKIRFIILIPHKDAAKSFAEYRQKLFSIGVHGAYSFPIAVPLAEVEKPFSREELKDFARNIRELTRERDGKINSERAATASCSSLSFFGPLLDLPVNEEAFPQSARGKLHCILPPVLCAAIVEPGINLSEEPPISEKAPILSFRAASLANLTIRPLTGAEYSFEWEIGTPVWLPNFHAKTPRKVKNNEELHSNFRRLYIP